MRPLLGWLLLGVYLPLLLLGYSDGSLPGVATATATATAAWTPTTTPSPTSTPTWTSTATATATSIASTTPTATSTKNNTPTVTPTRTPTATPIPAPAGVNVVCNDYGGAQICAWVSNGAPLRASTVTVYGRLLIGGAGQVDRTMTATWYYKSTSPTCTGATGGGGVASCSRNIGGATANYEVTVRIVIDGYQATTWFVPQ